MRNTLILAIAIGAMIRPSAALGQPRVELLSTDAEVVLRRLMATVPVDVVDLDEGDLITLAPVRTIGTADPSSDEDILLGASLSVGLLGDTLLVADYIQNAVLYASAFSQRFARAFGTQGDGPGEFRAVRAVFAEGDYLFVVDARKQGVLAFDRASSEYAGLIRVGSAGWRSADAGGGFLATVAGPTAEYRVDIRSATPPFRIARSIMPRLVGPGDAASSYNMVVLQMNDGGELVASYEGVPVLLLYDRRHTLHRVIVLESRSESLQRLTRRESGGSGSFRVYSWIMGLDLSNEGDIAISTSEAVYILSPGRDGYRLQRRLQLRTGPDGADTLVPFDIEFDGSGGFYAVSRGEARVYYFAAGRR